MDNLTAIRLLESLHNTPAVRIYTELESLKSWELLNNVQGSEKYERVWSAAWNKARLIMEYKNTRHIDAGNVQRIVMRSFRGRMPYRNPLTPYFFHESNRTS